MARCTNCNAPLSDGSIVCAYCGDRSDIDLKGVHYYTTHDNDSPRICPRCNVRLKSIDLKLQGRFLIERCDQCFGLFFDPGELEALLDASVAHVFEIDHAGLQAIANHPPAGQHPVSYIKCPVCSQLMNRGNFGAMSGVVVDRCRSHGVWLDGGELRQLMEWMKLGGKLLDEKKKHERQKEELRREAERIQVRQGGGAGHSPFDLSGESMSHSDPDLFEAICKGVRLLLRII